MVSWMIRIDPHTEGSRNIAINSPVLGQGSRWVDASSTGESATGCAVPLYMKYLPPVRLRLHPCESAVHGTTNELL